MDRAMRAAVLGRYGRVGDADCGGGERRGRRRRTVRRSQGISRSFRATSPAPRGSVNIEPAPATSVQSPAADGEAAAGLQLQTTPAEYPCRCVRCVGALSFLAGGGGVRWVNRSRRSSESRILRQYLKTHRGLEDFSGAVKRRRTAATAERQRSDGQRQWRSRACRRSWGGR